MQLSQKLIDAGIVIAHDFSPGDLGELIRIHGEGNARDFGYGAWHEAYCARIAADFVIDGGGNRGRAWLAKKDGTVIGSVFIVEQPDNAAQLRLLYAASSTRGLGLGGWLVEAAVAHCREAGFARMFLWTSDDQSGARRIYEALDFRLAETKTAQGWGNEAHELRFDLTLTGF